MRIVVEILLFMAVVMRVYTQRFMLHCYILPKREVRQFSYWLKSCAPGTSSRSLAPFNGFLGRLTRCTRPAPRIEELFGTSVRGLNSVFFGISLASNACEKKDRGPTQCSQSFPKSSDRCPCSSSSFATCLGRVRDLRAWRK